MLFTFDKDKRSKHAFSRPMSCEWCKHESLMRNIPYDIDKQKWKFDRWVTPTMVRYICKRCGHGTRYEVGKRQPSKQEFHKLGLMR